MNTLKIALVGSAGRMGRQLINAMVHTQDVELVGAIEQSDSTFLGFDAGELAGEGKLGILISDDLNSIQDQFDVLIDFSRPQSTLHSLNFCLKHHKRIVIGTTGFDEQGKQTIIQAAKHIPIVFSSNYSVGVNLVYKLLEKATKVMGDYADIEVIEAHHRYKVDAPSGTALSMGEHIAKVLNRDLKSNAVFCREGITGERKQTDIGFATIRAGDTVGEHTVWFADIGERVEISHKASSRMTFAKGAVRAAQWLKNKEAGLYDMTHVLDLENL